MVVRCPHGHENDPRNRFCEQCGARLENSAPREEVGQEDAAPIRCRSCGATATPGEAFCETCGAALTSGVDNAPGYDSYDAPTVYAPTPPGGSPVPEGERTTGGHPPAVGAGDSDRTLIAQPSGQAAAPDSEHTIIAQGPAGAADAGAPAAAPDQPGAMSNDPQSPSQSGEQASGVTCPVCGHNNLPGDSFCDNCGAALDTAGAAAAPSQTVVCDACGMVNDTANTFCEQCGAALQSAQPPATAAVSEVAGAADEAATAAAPEPQATAAAAPAPGEQQPAVAPAVEGADEEQQLEKTIARERDNVAMFEQMAARYSGSTPPASVTAGLEEAQRALAEAEARLSALREERRRPDPAEVARLEETIARERDNVAMFEQMAARYSGTTPPAYVTAGLEEARRALAEAEAQLAALTGGAAAATTPAAAPEQPPVAPVAEAPVEVAAPAPVAEPPAEAAAPSPPSPPSQPSQPSQPEQPAVEPAAVPAFDAIATLVVQGSGAQIPLAADKREYVIGREDPVSGIFPEVDMTPHDGEAGGVSRQHARLIREDDRWLLTDLESTNYTKVNGTKLQPHTPTPIEDGARLQFGRLIVTFQLNQP